MTAEWTLLATFWALYLLDNAQPSRSRQIQWLSHLGRSTRARLKTLPWRLTGLFPSTWRLRTAELPFSFSPEGLCNYPVGQTLRPADPRPALQAYRWADIQSLELRDGWIVFNQQKFCPDTGHLTYDQWRTLINALTGAPLATREKILRTQLATLVRPANLRRRTRLLLARTDALTTFATTTTLLAFLGTVYHLAGLSAYVPKPFAAHLADRLPVLVLLVVVFHFTAYTLALFARKKLFRHAPRPKGLGTKLASALLLPPQALKLRSLLGDAYLPPTLPLTAALACSPPAERAVLVRQTLTDLDHPLALSAPPAHPAHAITAWHRENLRSTLTPLLPRYSLDAAQLLAPPTRDTPQSCAYCPRCHDQFSHPAPTHCPHGIALKKLPD